MPQNPLVCMKYVEPGEKSGDKNRGTYTWFFAFLRRKTFSIELSGGLPGGLLPMKAGVKGRGQVLFLESGRNTAP